MRFKINGRKEHVHGNRLIPTPIVKEIYRCFMSPERLKAKLKKTIYCRSNPPLQGPKKVRYRQPYLHKQRGCFLHLQVIVKQPYCCPSVDMKYEMKL